MDYLTDTTLLIDLWREHAKPGAALRFVKAHEQAVVGVPWVVKAEFMRGAWLAGHVHDAVEGFLDSFLVVWPTEPMLRRYASLHVALRQAGAMIGPNDLWVAACAMELALPLLTRNAVEFSRVDGLTVINYAQPANGA